MANEKQMLTAQWALGIAGTALGAIALFSWQSLAGDVKANSEHRAATEGARLNERLCDVEKGLEWVKTVERISHTEDKHTRKLLNEIADKLGASPAPEVAELPPEPQSRSHPR